VLKYVPGKEDLLVRGTKARFAGMTDAEAEEQFSWVFPHDLANLGATEQFMQAVQSKRWRAWIPEAARFAHALERWGVEAVHEPGIRVGTIHSCKGQEADNVLLLTTLTTPCRLAMRTRQGADEEHRVFYVGVTRARRRLVVCNEGGVPYRKRVPT
jgi:superfamily I DNA/RNA helicase